MNKISIFVVVMALLLSACSTKMAQVAAPSPTADEVKLALEQPTPERKVSALKALQPDVQPLSRAIDLQTLITLQSVKMSPPSQGGVSNFIDEAEVLSQLVMSLPLYQIPEDTAVLLVLSGKGSPGLLDVSTQATLEAMCTSDETIDPVMESLKGQAASAAMKALASSCAFFVRGDWEESAISLSEALRWDLTSRANIIPKDVNPSISGGWDIFVKRFADETAVVLNASAARLTR